MQFILFFMIFGLCQLKISASSCSPPGNSVCYNTTSMQLVDSCCAGSQCNTWASSVDPTTDWYCQYIDPIQEGEQCGERRGQCDTGLNCFAGFCTADSACKEPGNALCYSSITSTMVAACCDGSQCLPWDSATIDPTNNWYCQFVAPIPEGYPCDKRVGTCAKGLTCADGVCTNVPTCLMNGTTCFTNGNTIGTCCTGLSCENDPDVLGNGICTDACLAEQSTCFTNGEMIGPCCDGYECLFDPGNMGTGICMTKSCLFDGETCFTKGNYTGSCCAKSDCVSDPNHLGDGICVATPCIPSGETCFTNGATVGDCCDGQECMSDPDVLGNGICPPSNTTTPTVTPPTDTTTDTTTPTTTTPACVGAGQLCYQNNMVIAECCDCCACTPDFNNPEDLGTRICNTLP